MPRFALKIEYHGAKFCGWQKQSKQNTIQGTIETALSKLGLGRPPIFAAGRTDSGVHALGQVAHLDIPTKFEPFRLSEALNYHLKAKRIAILDCAIVPCDWHARFSAIKRHYVYRILSRRAPATHTEKLVWHIKKYLDINAMQHAAIYLVGQHDFTTFRSAHCQAENPLKTLDQLTIEAKNTSHGFEIHIHAYARSFLHRQVRSIVGTLERVGAGAWSPKEVQKALEARDRMACGPVSPPFGLYLVDIGYAEDPFKK
ncbi:MAG: tRNA pseudouridine(38-40) synthase TruA [Aestuariivita sp.]|nr:tRNA pseudouridine(38-40) synthase TruA [Aestuariivita sp.]